MVWGWVTAAANVAGLGQNNPVHVKAMADIEAKCATMGIKADLSSELGLAELAMM